MLAHELYESVCGCCAYWRGEYFSPIFAERLGGSPGGSQNGALRVGQCAGCEASDHAPYVEGANGEAFVFTGESASCPAFSPHPELMAECAAELGLYESLEQGRAAVSGYWL